MTRDEEFDFLMSQVKQQIDLLPAVDSRPHLLKWSESTDKMLRICERRVADYDKIHDALLLWDDVPDEIMQTLKRDRRESVLFIDEYYKVLNAIQLRLAELDAT